MSNRITPFVKRMRANGGTIYTFSSAIEDIGLNINERNNLVKISNFALLNIPNISESSVGYSNNTFNVRNIAGAWEYEQSSTSVKDGRVLIAESFQNYALNLESNLLNQSTYNPELTATVSERVFWKWLKETGAIRWDDPSTRGTQLTYWTEEIDSNDYTSVVKYVGQVSAGNVRIDTFGTYNETYILLPTSHGQTSAYFKQVEDDNYKHGMEIGDLSENILGRAGYTKPHPDGLSYRGYYDFVDSSTQVGSTPYYMYYDNSTGSYTPGWWYSAEGIEPSSTDNAYLTDSSTYLNTKIYNADLKYDDGGNAITFRRSKIDCIQLEFNLNMLKSIYNDSALTYDKMAIDNAIDDAFDFNAALIYYTVYNSTQDEILATNLLGIMFLDAPSGSSADIVTSGKGIELPSLEKIMSGPTGFGTSYSLRLNIKTDNMLDDTTATIIDESTSDQLWAEEWQQAFANLDIAVNTLTQQNSTINYISGQYVTLQENQTQILNRLINVENQVNDISRDIQGDEGTVPLFSDGEDPLIESSIYMRFGRIGIFNKDPQFGVDIDSSVKTKDITIENAIRDTSGNVILGYGSPLRLGASTNYRNVEVYSGNVNPNIIVDSSNRIIFNGDVSIKNNLSIDESTHFKSNVYFEASIYSPIFDFSKKYLQVPQNVGVGLDWDGNFLNVLPNSDVSAAGSPGDIQFASLSATLNADSSLYWDFNNGRLGVWVREPSADIHVLNDIRFDGSLFNGDTEIKAGAQVTSPGLGRILMSDGTVTGIYGDYNLTYNGTTLNVNGRITVDDLLTLDGVTNWKVGTNEAGTGNNNDFYIGTGSSYKFIINNASNETRIQSKLKLPNISAGSQTHILFYNPTTDEVTYNTSPSSGGINWSGSTSNAIGTYVNSTTIQAEPNLTFDGTNLNVTGILNVTGGSAQMNVGGTANVDRVRVTNGSNGTPSMSFIGDTNTGFYWVSADTIGVTLGGTQRYRFENAGDFQLDGDIISSSDIKAQTYRFPTFGGYSTYISQSVDLGLNTDWLSFYINSSEKFRFTDGGTLHADGNIIGNSSTISDIRLKNDIEKLENSLEKIKQLEGISYKRKNRENDSTHFGLIAQEVEKVIPELILETQILGEEEEEIYKTIRYQELIPHLVEAIKEQQTQIEKLKEEINKLK